MAKQLLISFVYAAAFIPAFTARSRRPRRGLKLALMSVAAFNFVYVVLVIYVFPRILF